jgi:hypothetical protein
MRCERTVDAGAYVLGALSPTERAAYERHMAGCVECRDEVADLAVLPGLLGRLDAGTAVATLAAPPVHAPPEILAATLRAATAERSRRYRRHRWQLAGTGLAAACLAVLLGVGGATMGGGPQRPVPAVMAQMTPVKSNVPVIALVGYSAAGGGTDIHLLCLYENESPSPYAKVWNVNLVVYPKGGGKQEWLLSWPVGPGGDSTAQPFDAHSLLPPGSIDRFELAKDDGTPLLSYRPS